MGKSQVVGDSDCGSGGPLRSLLGISIGPHLAICVQNEGLGRVKRVALVPRDENGGIGVGVRERERSIRGGQRGEYRTHNVFAQDLHGQDNKNFVECTLGVFGVSEQKEGKDQEALQKFDEELGRNAGRQH